MRTAEQPMVGKPLALVAAVSLIFAMGSVRLVEATILAAANWNSSTTLDHAMGSTAPTVNVGTAITSGAGGRFGEGVNLASSLDQLSYSGVNNVYQNKGTISFWFRNTYLDLANNGAGKRLLDVWGTDGKRLVDIYWTGNSFDAYVGYGPGFDTGRNGYPPIHGDSTTWHYIVYEWDATAGISRLWEGSTAEGVAINNFTSVGIPHWTPAAAATIDIGRYSSDPSTRGTWDALYISDQLYYDPSLSSIPLPLGPLFVPEPSTMGLFGLGGLVVGWWRRRGRRAG